MLPVFCLSGIVQASQLPQIVVLSWLGPNGQVACRDTLYFDCPVPVKTDCAMLLNPKVVCAPGFGNFTFTFNVLNQSGFTASQVVLSTVTPLGAIVPTVFNVNIANGGNSGPLTATVTGIPGGQVCFNLTLHRQGPNGELLDCCTNDMRVCITLPECPDSCECADANDLSFGGFGNDVAVKCGNQTPVILPCPPAGALFYFHGDIACKGDSCLRDSLDWTIMGPMGALVTSGTLAHSGLFSNGTEAHFDILGLNPALFTPGTTYTLMVTWYCGNNPCKCTVQFVLRDCPSCVCGKFTDLFLRPTPGAPSIPVSCDNQPPFVPCPAPGQFFNVSGNFMCAGTNCPAMAPVLWTLIDPMNNVIATGSTTAMPNFNLALPAALFGKAGVYCLKLEGVCGNQKCPCLIKFRFELPCPNDDCVCGAYTNTFLRSGQGPSVPVACGGSAVPIHCPPNGQNLVLTGQFQCQGNACPMTAPMDWALYSPANVCIAAGSSVANPNFSIGIPAALLTLPGVYTLTLTTFCGNKECICEIKFVLDPPCPGDLCKCGQFSDLFWRIAQGAASVPVKCGDELTVGCNPSFNPVLNGLFQCMGTACPPAPPLHWELRKLPSFTFVASGNTTGPHFSNALFPSHFSPAAFS